MIFIIIKFHSQNQLIISQSLVCQLQKLSMKPIIQIDRLLKRRIEFLQSLFLISSFKEILKTQPQAFLQKHKEMEKEEIDKVTLILRCVRIDELFRKQFHSIALSTFLKISPSNSIRRRATGNQKDIMADYCKFFTDLKEIHVIQFLAQIFELHTYNQTTTIYVLLQLLFKFLRIKSFSYISSKILEKSDQTKVAQKKTTTQISGQPKLIRFESELSRKKMNSSASSRSRLITSSWEKDSKQSEVNMKIQSKTIVFQNRHKQTNRKGLKKNMLSLEIDRNRSIHSALESEKQPRKRVIRSFKNIQQTKQQNEANQIFRRESISMGSLSFMKKFRRIFKSEWEIYLMLIKVQTREEFSEETKGREDLWGRFEKKKQQWFIKHQDKLIVQICSRNDEIRKQMEKYADQFCNRSRQSN